MKAWFSLICLIGFTWSTFAASLPRREIRLQGNYNFNQIIVETEKQLDLGIHLPAEIPSKTSRKYNQIITLKQLCDAIVSQFAQNNIPLIYTYSKNDLTFKRSDVPKPVKRTPPKTSTYKKKQLPTISEPPQPDEEPYLPSWATRQPTQNQSNPPALSRQGIQSSPRQSGVNQFEEPFQVTLPKRQQTFQPSIPSKPGIGITDLDPLPNPTYNPGPVRPAPRNPQNNDSKFSITPYPENATAFINDAPSIVPGTGKENYIEWETRMKGALENQNVKVLENERLELERRLRWLDKQLP